MTRIGIGAMLAAWVCLSAAHAVLDTIDEAPGATLLLPYFEVDLDDANTVDTVLSVHNASAAPVIARLTMWTDLAVPVLAFDIFLTGFDVEEIYLREIFEGRYPPPSIPLAGSLERAVNGTTGRRVPELDGDCVGANHRDNVARGYVTIDATNTNGGPAGTGAGLIAPPAPNALWGDYRILQRGDRIAVGELLASIENAPASGLENLPARWGVRYLHGSGAVTDLIIWRDFSPANGIVCGPPTTVGADEDEVVVFDDNENAIGPRQRLPALAASRVRLGTALDVPFDSGWIALKLGAGAGTQAYVTSLTFGNGGGFAIRGIDLAGAQEIPEALQ
jgi:hypothetical protein